MKVILKSTESALAPCRMSDTSLQSRHCNASVSFVYDFPLRVVFDEEANEMYNMFVA